MGNGGELQLPVSHMITKGNGCYTRMFGSLGTLNEFLPYKIFNLSWAY
jgi:hypothetical protein